jgi:transposase
MKVTAASRPPTRARDKWLVSDELWTEIEPLLPNVKNQRRPQGGRPPVTDRQAMDGIFFVLKTGCPWRALDVTGICSGATAHRKFQEWRKAGVFKAFWKKELQRYDECKGIDWKWQSLDASFVKTPIAGSKKNRQKSHKSRQIGK